MKQTIYFRVDMNNKVATGHMMRCLSIAEVLRDYGGRAIFILADDNACKMLDDRGFDYIVMDTQWNDMEAEIPVIHRLIHDHHIEFLIIDSYYATENYLRLITDKVKTLYIDDFNRTDIFTDIILNYAIYSDESIYRLYNNNVKTLMGTSYVPLRKCYENLPHKKINDDVSNILILSGGGDPYNTVEECIDALVDEDLTDIYAVCGRYSDRLSSMLQKYNDYQNVHMMSSVDNIEEYMQRADLCISAAGTTLYELCACGTPTLSYVLADNQLRNAIGFDKRDIIPYLGDVRNSNIGKLVINRLEYMQDKDIREKYSYKMQTIVDGVGSFRVIRDI